MLEIEIKGKTVEDAISKGLLQLGCKREDTEIKILDEGASGLFGLMGAKPAVVLISAKEENCIGINKPADPKKSADAVEKTVTAIISAMGISINSIQTSFAQNTVTAKIISSDNNYIIGKGGQTLDALEYIAQIIANNIIDVKIKVILDCENYRLKQSEKLHILADKAVEYVKRTGKIYRFDPMSAKERKIIHLYLEKDLSVETFSEGEGAFRKVGIKLSDKKSA
ncbi:MAG: Jag N-terminal domain-containing protein [Endomicrobium sp.]|jgi:spoIIIJ-associated protein|nr:Jag N-terminal domain-containing protein [Endomicrobium sp.]